MHLYTFHRKDERTGEPIFYPLELRDDADARQAAKRRGKSHGRR